MTEPSIDAINTLIRQAREYDRAARPTFKAWMPVPPDQTLRIIACVLAAPPELLDRARTEIAALLEGQQTEQPAVS